MLLEDTSFVESILSVLSNQHTTAEYAVQTAGNSFATAFADMDSPYMQARGATSGMISNHLIRCLLDIQPLILLVTSLPFWFPTSCCPVKYWHWTGASCWAWSLARQRGQPHRHASSGYEDPRPGSVKHYPHLMDIRHSGRLQPVPVC